MKPRKRIWAPPLVRDHKITVMLTCDEFKKAYEIADQLGIPLSQHIRNLLRETWLK